jgi:hypothetical protein
MILYALQISPIDAREAVDLVHLICDIQPSSKCKEPREWLISYRRDTPLDRIWNIQKTLAAKFEVVHVSQATRYANGWPAGPNALWLCTMVCAADLRKNRLIKSDGVLTFEPDNVPARRDWMDRLESAYEHRIQPILGNLHQGTIPDHINGNAIFPVGFLKEYPEMLETPPSTAWDFYHRALLLTLAQDSPYLLQLYQRKKLTLEEWRALRKFTVRPALLHGIKDSSARELARLDLVAKNRIAPPRKLVLQP